MARIPAIGAAAMLGLTLLGVTPTRAQYSAGPVGGLPGAAQRTVRGAEQSAGAKRELAPPPVLPGTKAAPEAAAPTQAPGSMTPTEALFDAINRGDLAAARDAVNRGAELAAENVLGLTPLDLSVDLGRNDISFMLLSMREADTTSRDTARRGTSAGGGASAEAILTGGARERAASRPAATRVAARAPDEPMVESPRLFSGNGGAPIPGAGFLGFDAGRGR